MRVSVVHSAAGQGRGVPGSVVWRTCLREIAFVEAPAVSSDPGALYDEAAYTHLLEVICGLESPIVGETEVMHQFKMFVAGLPAEHAAIRDMSERLLVDARVVRARHLVGLGSRSYGSAVRRHVRDCSRVALVGTGMLAHELLPFLHDEGRALDLWGRCESPVWDAPGAVYRQLDSANDSRLTGASAIVVAAPIASAAIAALRCCYPDLVRLIDLRGEARSDPPPPPLVTLDDVYAELKAAEQATDRQAAAARAEIRRCAQAFVTRAKLNPSGWHDLCA